MTGVIHTEPLDTYLIEEPSTPQLGDRTEKLCLLSGNIAERNLKRQLTHAGLPASQLADYSTIEDIAQRLATAHHGSRARIIDQGLLKKTLEQVIAQADTESPSSPIDRAAAKFEWDDAAFEALLTELDAYFRAVDPDARGGTDDSELLLDAADGIDDPFAAHRSRFGVRLFDAIHDELADRRTELPEHVYLSRSHLVGAARSFVDSWTDVFGDIRWIGIATVNVLDNPTLRFVTALDDDSSVPDIHFFLRDGTKETLETRLDQAGVDLTHSPLQRATYADAGQQTYDVARNETGTLPDSVDLIESPDHRREVEHVVGRIRELLAEEDTTPSDVLVLARDAGDYRTLVADICTNNEVPYHIETRLPMANLPAYRFLKGTLELVERYADSPAGPVSYTAVIDPLRLGFCLSDGPDEPWPIPQAAFLRLEEQLGALPDGDEPGRSLPDWQALADTKRRNGGDEWGLLAQFLETVETLAESPPRSGTALQRVLDRYLQYHVKQTVSDPLQSPDGPAVNPGRTDLSDKHRSHTAERVLNKTGTVAGYFDRAQDLYDATADWTLANEALGTAIGENTYGTRSSDAQAIRVLDAGNAYFHSADHVFVLGLSAEQFPRELGSPTFVHERLRERVFSRGQTGTARTPFPYYESHESQYEQELDLYQAATHATTSELTLLHSYRDEEDNPVPWSSFVDYLEPSYESDAFVDRIAVENWLPGSQRTQQRSPWRRVAPRDRLRAYIFHTAPEGHIAGPDIDDADLLTLALWTDRDARTHLQSSIDRLAYSDADREITVPVDDPAFDGDVSFDDLAGTPLRTHEADLLAQCDLKFYYYQFLFNRDGDTYERDETPKSRSEQPTSRFGTLPNVIRDSYASPRFAEPLRELIESHDRQSLFSEFSDRFAASAWWDEHIGSEAPDILRTRFAREYQQFEEERSHGIYREWDWVSNIGPAPNAPVCSVAGHRLDTVVLPRAGLPADVGDSFAGTSHPTAAGEPGFAFQLPVYYLDGQIREASLQYTLKECWRSSDSHSRNDFCDTLCEDCDALLSCHSGLRFTLDHRLHATASAYRDGLPLGVEFIQLKDISANDRAGYLIDVGDGLPSEFEREMTRVAAEEWENNASTWRIDAGSHTLDPGDDGTVTFSVAEQFVDDALDEYGNQTGDGHDGCTECVYRDLCQLPGKVNQR